MLVGGDRLAAIVANRSVEDLCEGTAYLVSVLLEEPVFFFGYSY
jgi:hypothetical protein